MYLPWSNPRQGKQFCGTKTKGVQYNKKAHRNDKRLPGWNFNVPDGTILPIICYAESYILLPAMEWWRRKTARKD